MNMERGDGGGVGKAKYSRHNFLRKRKVSRLIVGRIPPTGSSRHPPSKVAAPSAGNTSSSTGRALIWWIGGPAGPIQEDDECADVDSSLEVAYLACWSISELMSMLMDIKFSLVRVFGAGLKVECSSIAVLFFPSPRFFPLGFSWEGFLRRQDRLAVYTPMMLLRDDFEALCTLKWFFPIGVIVSVLFS
ncbi:hypothetical protein Tco_0876339 [Tanacetum coccineum]|uniref:Uncharacterized protein n=1 Tax=Tanacetum coccineum TaxID=301880 RepID=A0ABQ5BTJ5_9ASTR